MASPSVPTWGCCAIRTSWGCSLPEASDLSLHRRFRQADSVARLRRLIPLGQTVPRWKGAAGAAAGNFALLDEVAGALKPSPRCPAKASMLRSLFLPVRLLDFGGVDMDAVSEVAVGGLLPAMVECDAGPGRVWDGGLVGCALEPGVEVLDEV